MMIWAKETMKPPTRKRLSQTKSAQTANLASKTVSNDVHIHTWFRHVAA